MASETSQGDKVGLKCEMTDFQEGSGKVMKKSREKERESCWSIGWPASRGRTPRARKEKHCLTWKGGSVACYFSAVIIITCQYQYYLVGLRRKKGGGSFLAISLSSTLYDWKSA